jgi:hypothetical protein
MQERRKISSSALETAIQDTLAAVVEIDRWYDLKGKELDLYPKAIRSEVAAEIKRLHRMNRQPYVLHLSRRHQMIVSGRIFGDPAAPLRPRRIDFPHSQRRRTLNRRLPTRFWVRHS